MELQMRRAPRSEGPTDEKHIIPYVSWHHEGKESEWVRERVTYKIDTRQERKYDNLRICATFLPLFSLLTKHSSRPIYGLLINSFYHSNSIPGIYYRHSKHRIVYVCRHTSLTTYISVFALNDVSGLRIDLV